MGDGAGSINQEWSSERCDEMVEFNLTSILSKCLGCRRIMEICHEFGSAGIRMVVGWLLVGGWLVGRRLQRLIISKLPFYVM